MLPVAFRRNYQLKVFPFSGFYPIDGLAMQLTTTVISTNCENINGRRIFQQRHY